MEQISKDDMPEQQLQQDAAEISTKLNEELSNINSIFKGTVGDWNQSCFFLPYTTGVPVLWIKMPFDVEAQLVPSEDRWCIFKLKTSVHHPSVQNGYLNGERLNQLFFIDLMKATDRISQENLKSGKSYKLRVDFEKIENTTIFDIKVFEYKHERVEKKPTFLYKFMLCIKFGKNADCYTSKSNFFARADSNVLQTQGFAKSSMLGNVERLTTILNGGYLPHPITKIIYGPVDWRPVNNLDDALLLVIKRTIPFMENPEQLTSVYEKLLQIKQLDTVSMPELRALFGLH